MIATGYEVVAESAEIETVSDLVQVGRVEPAEAARSTSAPASLPAWPHRARTPPGFSAA
ncbi:MAG: hypothetical protein R3F55_22240 [Alphaproteobacteria bacterium]